MKKIFVIIKKVVVALCMLYTVNLIVSKIGIMVPINTTSIISVSVLGLPAVLGILILYKVML